MPWRHQARDPRRPEPGAGVEAGFSAVDLGARAVTVSRGFGPAEMVRAARAGLKQADRLPHRPGIWHPRPVVLWLALRRLLPLLAVLSLALTPVIAPAATAGMHASMTHGHRAAAMDHHAQGHDARSHREAAPADPAGMDMADMDMADMPCCPQDDATVPDCAGGCPLMALCLGTVTPVPPAALRVPTPFAKRARVTWPDPASLSSVYGDPLPEPPRA
jgi:hypothetical protein